MAGRTKQSQSEIDGVKYRRAKTWQIILVACNALTGMSVYTLIGIFSMSLGRSSINHDLFRHNICI